MKRMVCLILAVCILGHCAPVRADGISAQSAILYEPLTGTVLFEKDSDTRRSMASTTKIMTALAALELYDPDRMVIIRPEWTGIEGSSMYLEAGEEMQILDLLYGLLLMSGNDAAVALSCLWTGNEADFVSLMNRKAAELGLKNTSFANPNGLEGEGHYSTAYDMAVLTAAAMENDLFREIVSTESAYRAGRQMTNHNKLLNQQEGCVGVKTGYTRKAGRCLVSAAEQQGRRLIAVTLSAPDDWNDHKTLFDMGFSGLQQVGFCTAGRVAEVSVADGQGRFCGIYSNEGFTMTLLPGESEQIWTEICGSRMIYGPVAAGDVYGEMKIYIGETLLFVTPLYYETEIEGPEKTPFWRRLFDRIFGCVL